MNPMLISIIAILFFMVIVILFISSSLSESSRSAAITVPKTYRDVNSSRPSSTVKSCSSSSSSSSCDAIDPVNDPSYNIKENIKNALLIEQHLADVNKYCKLCIIKHFLISIALLDEAIWMAGDQLHLYPSLQPSKTLFNRLFTQWHAHMDDHQVRLETLQQLRTWRQEIIKAVYL